MYLIGKKFMGYAKEEKLRNRIQKDIDLDYKIDYIEVNLGYWRKANHIHKWFVDNVQDGNDDCGTYYVSEEDLKNLLVITNEALESKNPENILPTQEGFFFGGTEYDEYYKDDLHNTKKILEKILNDPKTKELEIKYNSSW